MVSWLVEEAEYVLNRRHKISFDDVIRAPKFFSLSFLSNAVFSELDRDEMLERYPTWRYDTEGTLDPSFLKETQDARRGNTYEDIDGQIELEQPFVSRIYGKDTDSNPLFVGQPTPLSLTPDGEIIREIAKGNRSQINALCEQLLPLNWLPIYSRIRSGSISPKTHLEGDVLPLFQRKYPNYYHWVMDELPKLRAIEHYPEDVTIALEANPPPYVTESLDRLGFTEYVHIDESPVTADGILATIDRSPQFINMSYVSNEYISWLRSHAGIDGNGGYDSERIYVSRENSAARQVVNREELLSKLRKMGFRSYKLEERSFEDNLELFADAEIVVSPHGAGLTDIAFSEDVTVVELNTVSYPQPSFYMLSKLLGHDYHHVTCPAVDEAEYDIQRNMRVDVSRVVDLIASTLN